MPNSELTEARIKNFKLLEERRVAFDVQMPYQTSLEQLHAIPHHIEDIIRSIPNMRFGRVHFHRLGDSAYTFRVVFFVTTRSFQHYMDARQEFNYKLVETLTNAKMMLAYPTQTLRVETPGSENE